MRTMAAEGKEMYRVVIIWKRPWLYNGEEHESAYGPYNAIGTARGVLTRETVDACGAPRPWVVGGRVEKATTTWAKVD